MQLGYSDTLNRPAPPEPFALVIGPAMLRRSMKEIETAIRHMGLRPERIDGGDVAEARVEAPLFRLHFASVSILAGRASADALDLADPLHPSTSQLGASLPKDWRADGQCWVFIPEAAEAGADAEPVRMREFFKMLVLLIDLFDAGHIFWSPARLWSDGPQFRASIAEMLVSGMPPVLHLVAFRRREDDGQALVRTRGLALFGGQEIEGRIPNGWTVAEMVKRLARLALDIMLNGPVPEPRRLRGLEPGEWVSLSPQSDGDAPRATVLVEFGSDF